MSTLISNLQYKSRQKKLDLFESLLRPESDDRILIVGGGITGSVAKLKMEGFFYQHYSRLENVTVLDINEKGLDRVKELFPATTCVHYSGGGMPFDDKSFDLLFCNAVIEHVGNWDDQIIFANEIMRVSKNFFVTTPNYWFPFEFHYRLPFIHWFSKELQQKIKKVIGGRYPKGSMPEPLALLSTRDLRKLFPGNLILKQRFLGWPATLTVVGGERVVKV
jgi:ubiquinone/menaquinone biosynthesis C-methylase UbiE